MYKWDNPNFTFQTVSARPTQSKMWSGYGLYILTGIIFNLLETNWQCISYIEDRTVSTNAPLSSLRHIITINVLGRE